MRPARWILWSLVAAAAAAGVAVALDLRRAYQRVAQGSEVVTLGGQTVEFARGGAGPPVLVVHGSGGGFDQGALVAQAVLGDGFGWIAPSRFGYLRSTVRPGATFDDQAHAYAALLDRLGIERVAVVALSHGGPSALLFAALYPQRVSSLVLLSCGVAASDDAAQADANRKGDALTTVFRFDLLYWAASHLFRRSLITLMGADDAVLAGLGTAQRELVGRVIDEMNPVAPRYPGVLFDHLAAMPNERIAAIRAPTLVVHATDDRLQLFHNAEYAVRTIPGARLLRFERGGHLVIAVENDAVREQTQAFLRTHAAR